MTIHVHVEPVLFQNAKRLNACPAVLRALFFQKRPQRLYMEHENPPGYCYMFWPYENTITLYQCGCFVRIQKRIDDVICCGECGGSKLKNKRYSTHKDPSRIHKKLNFHGMSSSGPRVCANACEHYEVYKHVLLLSFQYFLITSPCSNKLEDMVSFPYEELRLRLPK